MMSLAQVADVLGVSRNTVYRWVKAGKMPAYRIGAGYRIRPADLEAYAAERFISVKAA